MRSCSKPDRFQSTRLESSESFLYCLVQKGKQLNELYIIKASRRAFTTLSFFFVGILSGMEPLCSLASALKCTTQDMTLRSVLNALAISYHCRLPDRRLRNAYRAQIAQILIHHRVSLPRESRQSEWKDQDIINWLLNNEKTMWVRHMTLPDMTATNEALVENIFVGTSI